MFLHLEDGEVVVAGDEWLIRLQETQREAYVERQREIKERGFLRVMWPQLVASILLLGLWVYVLKTLL